MATDWGGTGSALAVQGGSVRRTAGPAVPRHRFGPAIRACSALLASCRPAARTLGPGPAPISLPPLAAWRSRGIRAPLVARPQLLGTDKPRKPTLRPESR